MHVHDVLATLESKALGPLSSRAFDGTVNSVKRSFLDSLELRATRLGLDNLVKEHVDWVKAKVEARSVGDEKTARDEMLKRFGVSAQVGMAVCGVGRIKLPNETLLSLASLIETELEFLRKFVAGDEAMSPSQRANLYGSAVTASFYRGWIAGLPTGATIDWRLSIAEHCKDCLALEVKSPYTKPGYGINPLPTTPGNGDTKCLGNCRCYLEATGPGGFISHLKPKVSIEITEMGGRETDPTSPAARAWSDQFQDLAERVLFFNRMHELDPKGGWGAKLEAIKAQVGYLAEKNGLVTQMSMTKAEMLEALHTAQAHGLQFVNPRDLAEQAGLMKYRGLLNDTIIWLLAADYALHGRVMGVFGGSDPAIVLGEDQQTYYLDERSDRGRYIAFYAPAS